LATKRENSFLKLFGQVGDFFLFSLPYLYPPPPRGRGRIGERPSPTLVLPLPKGGGGERGNSPPP